jgi:hypothetical protein
VIRSIKNQFLRKLHEVGTYAYDMLRQNRAYHGDISLQHFKSDLNKTPDETSLFCQIIDWRGRNSLDSTEPVRNFCEVGKAHGITEQ